MNRGIIYVKARVWEKMGEKSPGRRLAARSSRTCGEGEYENFISGVSDGKSS